MDITSVIFSEIHDCIALPQFLCVSIVLFTEVAPWISSVRTSHIYSETHVVRRCARSACRSPVSFPDVDGEIPGVFQKTDHGRCLQGMVDQRITRIETVPVPVGSRERVVQIVVNNSGGTSCGIGRGVAYQGSIGGDPFVG